MATPTMPTAPGSLSRGSAIGYSCPSTPLLWKRTSIFCQCMMDSSNRAHEHTDSHQECTHADSLLLLYTEKIVVKHTHMHAHTHIAMRQGALSPVASAAPAPGPPGPQYPAQRVLQLGGLHERVRNTVSGQHYSGPGPWHPALLDRVLSDWVSGTGEEGVHPCFCSSPEVTNLKCHVEMQNGLEGTTTVTGYWKEQGDRCLSSGCSVLSTYLWLRDAIRAAE